MDDAMQIDGLGAPGIDLEAWREGEGLSYGQLAERLGLTQAQTARRYALGERVVESPDLVDRIREVTGGRVTEFAMYRRRQMWLRQSRKLRRVIVRVPAAE